MFGQLGRKAIKIFETIATDPILACQKTKLLPAHHICVGKLAK